MNKKRLGEEETISQRTHQRIISKINVGLRNLYEKGIIQLEPLPETDLDQNNPQSPCPDLILSDNEKAETLIIIEIAHNFGYKNDLKKIIQILNETEFGIREAFVYNYPSDEWNKYTKSKGLAVEKKSYSDILGLTLADFLA